MQSPTPVTKSSIHEEFISQDPTDAEQLIFVSSTFHFNAQQFCTGPSDMALYSSDGIFFSVHSYILLEASDNGFNYLISPILSQELNPVVYVPETAAVLNVILHTIYDVSCAQYSPTFQTLITAVEQMVIYGVCAKTKITPSSPLYSMLLSHAPLFPIDLYALASRYDMYSLAVSTSSHLLSFPLFTLTDELAQRIGPVYLKRLFFLHISRSDALKHILLSPPKPHGPTEDCDFSKQGSVTSAWASASAFLAWEVRPDISTSVLESTFRPLLEHITCAICRESMSRRIKDILIKWSLVKHTI